MYQELLKKEKIETVPSPEGYPKQESRTDRRIRRADDRLFGAGAEDSDVPEEIIVP